MPLFCNQFQEKTHHRQWFHHDRSSVGPKKQILYLSCVFWTNINHVPPGAVKTTVIIGFQTAELLFSLINMTSERSTDRPPWIGGVYSEQVACEGNLNIRSPVFGNGMDPSEAKIFYLEGMCQGLNHP
jgi:hypothetical protein